MTSKRELFLFLEGVIVGVYGNWLISYVDKIQAELSSVHLTQWVQLTLVCFSLVAFMGFIIFMFLEPKMRSWLILLAGFIHLFLLYYAHFLSVLEYSLPVYMQFVMGVSFLFILYFIDMQRKRTPGRGYGKVLG